MYILQLLVGNVQSWGEYYSGILPAQNDKDEYTKT